MPVLVLIAVRIVVTMARPQLSTNVCITQHSVSALNILTRAERFPSVKKRTLFIVDLVCAFLVCVLVLAADVPWVLPRYKMSRS